MNREALVLQLAARDPRIPWPVKLGALLVAAYALSPVDLIPDFIPVLGLLDDIILVPAGAWLVMKAISPEVLQDLRQTALHQIEQRPRSGWGAALVIGTWLLLAIFAAVWSFT